MIFKKTKYSTIYTVLSIILVLLIIVAARTGAVNISYGEIYDFLYGKIFGVDIPGINKVNEGLFYYIRLPRTFMCVVVGAGLSVSGALMQSLFRNPIVEPGIIGTSAGAAFGAAFVFVFGKMDFLGRMAFFGDLFLPVAAFAGAFLATMVVYKFSSSFGKVNITTMILAGMAVNAMAAGGTGFLAYIARDPQARSITFWNLGTFSGADWKSFTIVLVVTLFCIIFIKGYAKQLNAMQLGETEAGYLGVNTERTKIILIVINTLMVSIATSFVGVISFVGLVVPHLLRLMKGSDNRYLIIGSALLGGILMAAADMLCRVIIAPAEMPIGIITAFIGAPFFLWLLNRNLRAPNKGGFFA